ncbi:hypothetical protein Droror1_Dr00010193 [Drosera rotundifolia]
MGYMFSMLTGLQTLPPTATLVTLRLRLWTQVFDVKVIAEGNGLFDGKKRELGLHRLAELMGVTRSAGVVHQAGSDSLLTTRLFEKMRKKGLNIHGFHGCLYGIKRSRPATMMMPPPMLVYPWSPLGFMGYPGDFSYRTGRDILVLLHVNWDILVLLHIKWDIVGAFSYRM